jgi:predicted MPP superfamily phosphohydrolase
MCVEKAWKIMTMTNVLKCLWILLSFAQFGWGQAERRTVQEPLALPFFFVQFADPQLEGATETANFEYAVAVVNHLRPAFVVICGDLVENTGDAREINEYFRILSKIDPDIPVYNVAGNHDVGTSPTNSYWICTGSVLGRITTVSARDRSMA